MPSHCSSRLRKLFFNFTSGDHCSNNSNDNDKIRIIYANEQLIQFLALVFFFSLRYLSNCRPINFVSAAQFSVKEFLLSLLLLARFAFVSSFVFCQLQQQWQQHGCRFHYYNFSNKQMLLHSFRTVSVWWCGWWMRQVDGRVAEQAARIQQSWTSANININVVLVKINRRASVFASSTQHNTEALYLVLWWHVTISQVELNEPTDARRFADKIIMIIAMAASSQPPPAATIKWNQSAVERKYVKNNR